MIFAASRAIDSVMPVVIAALPCRPNAIKMYATAAPVRFRRKRQRGHRCIGKSEQCQRLEMSLVRDKFKIHAVVCVTCVRCATQDLRSRQVTISSLHILLRGVRQTSPASSSMTCRPVPDVRSPRGNCYTASLTLLPVSSDEIRHID